MCVWYYGSEERFWGGYMRRSIRNEVKSIWISTTPKTNYPTLEKDSKVDVAVIGGGMAGLSIAYFLKTHGLKVGVLEGGRIASATSGNTTAKITSLHGLIYASLAKKFGKESAQIYANSNQWAIGEIERIIRTEKIDCDFYNAPAFTYTSTRGDMQEIVDELNVCLQLGLPASYETTIDGAKIKISGAVKFADQAYFHPRKYLLRLAKTVDRDGSYVWENSRVMGIEENGTSCLVKTDKGHVVAKSVVVATNKPFYDPDKIFTKLKSAGSFMIAVSGASTFPEVMCIGTQGWDMSYRPHRDGKKKWLIIGARHDENPGSKSLSDAVKLLVKLAKKHFQAESIDYQWGAVDTMSLDGMPYIGRFPKRKNIYVATGFSAWGMTQSVVAARLIGDLILGKKNEWEDLYDPKRLIKR